MSVVAILDEHAVQHMLPAKILKNTNDLALTNYNYKGNGLKAWR